MSELVHLMEWWLSEFEWFILAYFLVLNTTYLVLTILAAVEFFKYFRRVAYAGHDDLFANPLTPGVSVVVPAYNEEVGIVDSVRAMLSLRFPKFEIVVVDDGSTDSTFELLQTEFDLVEVPHQMPANAIETTGAILSVWTTRRGEPLVVVRKENASSRSDSLNAGLNVARMELVCMVDADSLLDPEALLRVVKPFVDDPNHVVGTGGVIRPANGCVVENGTITKTSMPRGWLARIQVIEYLRAFLLGRTGWSTLQGMLIISGAFGMFRRELVLELGGLDRHCMGEDCELVTRIHHHYRSQGRRDYKLVFVSEPVCWTEVPATHEVLARQRKRWSRGLAEVLWTHKRMMMNPKYGRIGLVVLPHYLFFELLGPIVELLGAATFIGIVALNIAGHIFGYENWLLNTHFAVLFFFVAILYGFFLSLAAITVEEFSFHRMNSWRDLWASLGASILENIGYRQMHAWWRLKGLWWWLRKGKATWGAMPRQGYVTAGETPGRVIGAPAKNRPHSADEDM